MQCPDCGATYSQEDEFCGECGHRLQTETPPGELPGLPQEDKAATIKHRFPLRQPTPPRLSPRRSRSSSDLLLKLGVVIVLLLFCGVFAAVFLIPILGLQPVEVSSGAAPVQGKALYQDDFRDPASGWESWDDGGTSAKYVDGDYQLGVSLSNYMVWSHPASSRDFRDFVIDVEARQVEGSLNSTFGPIVRVQAEEEHYYWFQISGDGYFSVELKEEGEWILLQRWKESDAIKQGLDVTNRLRVYCYGDLFSFYVNDIHLIDVTDEALRAGNIGLAAGAYDEPPVTVQFDNLVVYELRDYQPATVPVSFP